MPSRRYSDCATATGSERAGSGEDGVRAMLQHYGGEGCRSMNQATRRRIVTKAIPAECAVLGRSVGGGGRAVSPRRPAREAVVRPRGLVREAGVGRDVEPTRAGPGSRRGPGRWGLRGPTAGEVTRDRSAWRPGSTPEFHFDGHAASKVEFEGLAM